MNKLVTLYYIEKKLNEVVRLFFLSLSLSFVYLAEKYLLLIELYGMMKQEMNRQL